MQFKRLLSVGLGAVAAGLVATGSASAAFPDFSDCPTSNAAVDACAHIQSTGGSMTIKGFAVPIGTSLQIRGGLDLETGAFIPPRGTTGVFAKPIQVPGGILGINFPIPGNAVTATAKLAGSPSDVHLDPFQLGVSLPVKLELRNPLIGPFCQIGGDSNPVHLNLITGTTNPPAPNRPISGQLNVPEIQDATVTFLGNRNVDNSFAIPGAQYCGLGVGLINTLINAKLRLPSAAGNNAMIVENNLSLFDPRWRP